MRTQFCAAAIVLGIFAYTAGALVQDGGASAAGYAWADACKTCHEDVYEAWSRTKHASALDSLSSVEQEQVCVGCHVTGPKSRVLTGTRVLNRGVQCEACHGADAAHERCGRKGRTSENRLEARDGHGDHLGLLVCNASSAKTMAPRGRHQPERNPSFS